MKKNFLVLLALVGVLALVPVSAGAVLVNFDSLPLGNIDGVALGDPFPNGVKITSADGSTYVANGNQPLWGYTSIPNVVTNFGFLVNNPMTFTFDVPRGTVGFSGGDNGIDQDRFTVTAYDINGNQLAFVDTGVFGGNAPSLINYMVDQVRIDFTTVGYIKTMVVQAFSVNGAPGILIDDLTYCHPTPIPGSLLLLGSGLVGLVGLRLRRRS